MQARLVFSRTAHKRLRSEQGLSLNALERISGIASQQIGGYERGRHTPGGPNIAKLAHALGCRFEDLLEEEQPDAPRVRGIRPSGGNSTSRAGVRDAS